MVADLTKGDLVANFFVADLVGDLKKSATVGDQVADQVSDKFDLMEFRHYVVQPVLAIRFSVTKLASSFLEAFEQSKQPLVTPLVAQFSPTVYSPAK